MEAREDREKARAAVALSAADRAAGARRDSISLSRTRVARELEGARNPRHRQILENALAHLDAELRKIP